MPFLEETTTHTNGFMPKQLHMPFIFSFKTGPNMDVKVHYIHIKIK